jgi:TolA-binding protein
MIGWLRGALLGGLVALGAGCASIGLPGAPLDGQTDGARLVARADRLARDGQIVQARDLYEQVVREHRGDPARARALYGLGRLQVDPFANLRDYRAAHAVFDRILLEYPQSPLVPEARAWRAALAELLAREDEASRLKADLRRLRRLDQDLERRR